MAVESLVGLEDARTRAIELMASSYAAGVFDIDEYERRVELAEMADTVAILEGLTADLRSAETALAPASAPNNALAIAAPEAGRVLSIFGGSVRNGTWIVPRTLKVWSVMGGSDLDFREAQLAPGVTEVKVFTMMGGTQILVPPGLHVQVDGSGILGGFDSSLGPATAPDPTQPMLRITGVAIMGGIDVSERHIGESARQARKRRRLERKQRAKLLDAKAARKQLERPK